MGRANFTITNVTRQTYVCSDHFDENVVLDYRLVSIFFLESSHPGRNIFFLLADENTTI